MKNESFKKILILIALASITAVIVLSKSLIVPLIFSIAVAYLLKPICNILVDKGMNKRVAAFLSISVLILLGALLMFFILPGVTKDTMEIINNLGTYSKAVQGYVEKLGYNRLPSYIRNVINSNVEKLNIGLANYMNETINKAVDFLMEIPTYSLVPIFVYYFLADADYFISLVKALIPVKMRPKTIELSHEIDEIIGSFIKSQLILSLVITSLTFPALLILRIRYSLVIALINGVTNMIPYFGPVIGLVPALFSALTQSLDKAIWVCVAFFVIQQFENSFIAPRLMGDSIGLHPVIVMIVLLLGGKFFGGWGLILSAPVAGAIRVTYIYLLRNLY